MMRTGSPWWSAHATASRFSASSLRYSLVVPCKSEGYPSDAGCLAPIWTGCARHSITWSALPLGLERKFLECVAVCRGTTTADCEGPGDLAHVDSALGVDGKTMWRGKAAGGRSVRCAPAGQQSTVRIEDADPAVTRLRHGTEAARDITRVPPELRHIRAALGVKDNMGRPLGVCPLVQVLAVRAEDLDAVALPVTHED